MSEATKEHVDVAKLMREIETYKNGFDGSLSRWMRLSEIYRESNDNAEVVRQVRLMVNDWQNAEESAELTRLRTIAAEHEALRTGIQTLLRGIIGELNDNEQSAAESLGKIEMRVQAYISEQKGGE